MESQFFNQIISYGNYFLDEEKFDLQAYQGQLAELRERIEQMGSDEERADWFSSNAAEFILDLVRANETQQELIHSVETQLNAEEESKGDDTTRNTLESDADAIAGIYNDQLNSARLLSLLYIATKRHYGAERMPAMIDRTRDLIRSVTEDDPSEVDEDGPIEPANDQVLNVESDTALDLDPYESYAAPILHTGFTDSEDSDLLDDDSDGFGYMGNVGGSQFH